MHRALAVALVLFAAACSNGNSSASSAAASPDAAAASAAPAESVAAASADPAAPAHYHVDVQTSRGPFVIAVDRAQAPIGADHFYALVKAKYYDGARFYRVVPHFVVQFGAAADPKVTKAWSAPIPDDPVKATNGRGTVAFAATGAPNSRSTHVFVNLGNNANLDAMGFAPFGRVTSGMDVVDHIYAGYGEQPDQEQIADRGNAYLQAQYPKLDYIRTASVAP